MAIKVRLYSDKEGKQFKLAIPKKIVELLGYKHRDEFELEIQGQNILLKRVEE